MGVLSPLHVLIVLTLTKIIIKKRNAVFICKECVCMVNLAFVHVSKPHKTIFAVCIHMMADVWAIQTSCSSQVCALQPWTFL